MSIGLVSDQMSARVDTERRTPKSGWLEVSRSRAFFTHLGMSASVVGFVCALIFFVWYPHPYFQATGAWNVLRVLVGVDLVVGPLLTLILFKPGKWGLKFDLCVIALVQLAALIYGVSVIYVERPYFTVFALDRFYVLARKDVDQAQLADPALVAPDKIGAKPLLGPLLVVATRPTDTTGMQRLLEETLFQGKPDIERRPEFWSAYTQQTAQVLTRSRPLTTLKTERPQAAGDIDGLVAALGRAEDKLAFLPVLAKNRDLSMIIDATNGTLLEVLDVDPWVNAPATSD
jgi:hypothetical protein